MPDKCDVCGGSGNYLIFDMHGRERYEIQCPECWGTGAEEPPKRDTTEYEYPPSTAVQFKTMDELKIWMGWKPDV